jgi:tRNA dimethylallyltransferase
MKTKLKIALICIVGPTACGKTALAIEIANKFNGELINADSRQIYKYIDIGTAKGEVRQIPNSKIQTLDVWEIENVPIHLINIVEPDEILTLAQYQHLAYSSIDDIAKRGKLPILVGGTGLYIDAVTKGYCIPKIKPNVKLRQILNKLDVPKLQKRLLKINKKRFQELNESDRANKHRLIRLIEIENSKSKINRKEYKTPNLKLLFLTPAYTREPLYRKINLRSAEIVNAGLAYEVKGLIKKGYKFSLPAMTAISYKFVKEFLDKKITKKELIEKFAQGDRNYARRQITWFKRYPIIFIESKNQMGKILKSFLKREFKLPCLPTGRHV